MGDGIKWHDILNEFGIAWGLLIMTGIVLVRIITKLTAFATRKFFSDELDAKGKPKGYVPLLVETHVDLMEKLKDNITQQTDVLKSHSEVLTTLKTESHANQELLALMEKESTHKEELLAKVIDNQKNIIEITSATSKNVCKYPEGKT